MNETLRLQNLSKGLVEMLDSGQYCDVKIQGHDGHVFAHKVVLGAVCKGTQFMLKDSTFVLSEYTKDSISALVKYIYTGSISKEVLSEKAMSEIQKLADYVFCGESSHLQEVLKNILLNSNLDRKFNSHKSQKDSFAACNSEETYERENSSDEEHFDDLSDPIVNTTSKLQEYESENLNKDAVSAVSIKCEPDNHEPISKDVLEQAAIQKDTVIKEERNLKKKVGTSKRKATSRGQVKRNVKKRKCNDEKTTQGSKISQDQISILEQDVNNLENTLMQLKGICTDSTEKSVEKKKKNAYAYTCTLCDYKCRTKQQKYHHLHKKHGVPLQLQDECRIFKCGICDFQTLLAMDLEVHVAKHKKADANLSCDICSRNFCHEILLRRHMRNVHPKTRGTVYTCDLCDYKTKRKGTMDGHIWRHKHDKKEEFICEICCHKLLSKKYFHCHQYSEHGIALPAGETYYSCKYCKFSVPYEGKYLDHMRRHKGENPFTCEYCGKGFPSKTSLTSHVKWHEDEQKMSCPYPGCQFMTPRKEKLKRHVTNIHESQDKKAFVCHLCSFGTNVKGNLTLHLRNTHDMIVGNYNTKKRGPRKVLTRYSKPKPEANQSQEQNTGQIINSLNKTKDDVLSTPKDMELSNVTPQTETLSLNLN